MCVEEGAHGAEARREGGVAGGAVGDAAAVGFDEGEFLGGEVDCVREDGARGEEVVGGVDVGVGG